MRQRVTTGYGTARKDARTEGRGYFTRDGRRYALVARGGVLVEADLGPVEPVDLDSFFAATDPDGEEVAA